MLDGSNNARAWSHIHSSLYEDSADSAPPGPLITSSMDDFAHKPSNEAVGFRPGSPNLSFHRIASDQLIVMKKKPPKVLGKYLFGDVLGLFFLTWLRMVVKTCIFDFFQGKDPLGKLRNVWTSKLCADEQSRS